MPSAGTTQSKIRNRRASGRKAARLKVFLRRFGFFCAITIFLIWLGAWIVLSGSLQVAAHKTQQAFHDFTAARGYVVDKLVVEGRRNTDPEILRALINIAPGDPLFAVNPREVRELIMRLSWVKSVQVERRLPDTVFIGLTEREPMALWQNKGKIRLIDAEGVTLTDEKIGRFGKLPIVVGEDAPRQAAHLIEMLAIEPVLAERVEAATWVGERRWDLKMNGGMIIKLPEGDLALALRRLAQAQEDDAILDKSLAEIDLRDSNRLIVRTQPGIETEYKTGNDI